MPDLNANDIEAVKKIVAGTAFVHGKLTLSSSDSVSH